MLSLSHQLLQLFFVVRAEREIHHKSHEVDGRSYQYVDQAIECLLMLKAVYRLPYRQTVGLAQSILDMLNANVRVPDYTTLCKRSPELKIEIATSHSDEAKHIVMDSTGVKSMMRVSEKYVNMVIASDEHRDRQNVGAGTNFAPRLIQSKVVIV